MVFSTIKMWRQLCFIISGLRLPVTPIGLRYSHTSCWFQVADLILILLVYLRIIPSGRTGGYKPRDVSSLAQDPHINLQHDSISSHLLIVVFTVTYKYHLNVFNNVTGWSQVVSSLMFIKHISFVGPCVAVAVGSAFHQPSSTQTFINKTGWQQIGKVLVLYYLSSLKPINQYLKLRRL